MTGLIVVVSIPIIGVVAIGMIKKWGWGFVRWGDNAERLVRGDLEDMEVDEIEVERFGI